MSIYSTNIVRRSVGQATKGKRASLLMDVVILVNFLTGSKAKHISNKKLQKDPYT